MRVHGKLWFWLILIWVSVENIKAQPGLPLEYDFPAATAVIFPHFASKILFLDAANVPATPPVDFLNAPARIPAAYNYDHLGVFCQFEVVLERKFRLPIKVRLGEVNYADWLEYGYEN